jgi:hypothetical protein
MGLFSFLGNKKYNAEDSLPQTNSERWLATACAIWSEYCGGSWKYIGGYEKNLKNIKMLKKVLNNDWCITTQYDGVSIINFILNAEIKNEKDEFKLAFDYTCGINICGRMFLCNYISKTEYVKLATPLALLLQEKYHSWEEFCQGYIEGTKLESDVAGNTKEFETAYAKLTALSDNPYEIDWNLPF